MWEFPELPRNTASGAAFAKARKMAMLDENVCKNMHFPLKIRRIPPRKSANGGGDLFEVVTVHRYVLLELETVRKQTLLYIILIKTPACTPEKKIGGPALVK